MDTPLSKSATVRISNSHQPDVFVPKSFPGKDETEPMWRFKPYELRFLDALHRGDSIERACVAANVDGRRGERILKGKKAREYLSDLMRQKVAAEGWSQEKWLSEISKVWYGQKAVNREQMEAIKEIGARICPKPDRAGDGRDRPVINIVLDMAEAAIRRQDVIEAKIVREPRAGPGNIPGSVQTQSPLPL
jgi:hypothetical protein